MLETDSGLAFDLQNSSFLTLGGMDTPTVQLSQPFLNGKTDFWNKVVPRLIHYIDSGVLPSDMVEDLERDYFICRIVAGVFITATFVLIIILMILICLIRPKRANVWMIKYSYPGLYADVYMIFISLFHGIFIVCLFHVINLTMILRNQGSLALKGRLLFSGCIHLASDTGLLEINVKFQWSNKTYW